MNTKVSRKWVFILIILLLVLAVFPVARSVGYADTQITESDMDDSNLYSKLLKLGGGIVRSETFNKEKYSTIALTGVTTANTDSNIVDLSGLKLFKFDYTKVLDLSNNNITTISADVLNCFPNLEELILTNNDINSIDLSGCYNLKRLIIDDNNLKKIDLSSINPSGAEIDLSNNYISSMSNIVLPSQTVNVSATIKLYNNNISDYESSPSGYVIHLGIQGLHSTDNTIEKKQKITYYKTSDEQSLKVVISQNDVAKYTLSNDSVTSNATEIALDNGSYDVSYYYLGEEEKIISNKGFTVRTGDEYYKDYFRYYKYTQFQVIPSQPTFVYVIDGVEYDQADVDKITKKVTIRIFADDDVKVYYSIANGEWQEGREISVTQGGRYVIDVKAVSMDGQYTSRGLNIFISASSNLKVPDILIILLIVIGAILIFGVGYPLLKKYVL